MSPFTGNLIIQGMPPNLQLIWIAIFDAIEFKLR